MMIRSFLCLMVCVCAGLAWANEPFTPAADLRGKWAVQVDPKLPNVLILGDSISIGYTLPVRELLCGKANVLRPMRPDGRQPDNCGDTTMGLAKLDQYLALQGAVDVGPVGRRWDWRNWTNTSLETAGMSFISTGACGISATATRNRRNWGTATR